MDARQNFFTPTRPGNGIKLIGGLAVEPKRLAVAEIGGKTHGGVSGDAALSGKDVLDTALRHARVKSKARLTDTQGLKKVFIEDFARMDGGHTVIHEKLLVVIDDFYGFSVAVTPDKANSPLVVDADAVLTFAVAFKGFEPVSGRNAEILKRDGVVKDFELSHGRALQFRRKAFFPEAEEKTFGHAVFKAANHTKWIIRNAYNCKYKLRSDMEKERIADFLDLLGIDSKDKK